MCLYCLSLRSDIQKYKKKQVSVLVLTSCVGTDTLIDQLTHAVALSEENVHMGNILL